MNANKLRKLLDGVSKILVILFSGGQSKREEKQELSVTVSLNTGRARERLSQVERAD